MTREEILAHNKDSMTGSYFCCNYFYYLYRGFLERKIKEKQTNSNNRMSVVLEYVLNYSRMTWVLVLTPTQIYRFIQ